MPTPRKGEKRKDWMKRCIPILVNEGRDSDQAVAICSSMWENRKKKKHELIKFIQKLFGYTPKDDE